MKHERYEMFSPPIGPLVYEQSIVFVKIFCVISEDISFNGPGF